MRRADSAACARTSKQRETEAETTTQKKRIKNGQVARIRTTMKHLVFFFYGEKGCGLACQQRSWSSLGYSFSTNNSGSVWLHVWQRVKDIYVFAVLFFLFFFFFSYPSWMTDIHSFFCPFFSSCGCVMLSFFTLVVVCVFFFPPLFCCCCFTVCVLVECDCYRGV